MWLASFILNSPAVQNVLLLLEPKCVENNSTNVCHCTEYELQVWNGNLITEFGLLCERAMLARPDLFFNIGVVSSCFFGIFFDSFEVLRFVFSTIYKVNLNIRDAGHGFLRNS